MQKNLSVKNLLMVLALGFAALNFSNAALAHGSSKPKHGGTVQIVGEMSFELVTAATGVELYLEDEGDAVPSTDATAKLTVVNAAGAKSEIALTPAAGNKFEARGVNIASGATVTVLLKLKDESKLNASFAIK